MVSIFWEVVDGSGFILVVVGRGGFALGGGFILRIGGW